VILLPTLLTDLEIDEVSLVEQGANNKKIIFKSAQFEDSIMSTVNDKLEADGLEKSAEDVRRPWRARRGWAAAVEPPRRRERRGRGEGRGRGQEPARCLRS
jgi:hypothetical protein